MTSGAAGSLIVNADDWGRDRDTTSRTLECALRGAISSVSAMVFMEDSERAAGIARERGIDAGLHLNLTSPFTAPGAPARLAEHQRRISGYLLGHRYAQVVFHPGLVRSFEYAVSAQVAEYVRLYGTQPLRIDGHHHMHLCSNVILGRLLQAGTVVRRNFSFGPGEKSLANRLYRRALDRILERRHLLADFLFSLPPLNPPARLRRIFSLARKFAVELETHPVNPDEYRFLTGCEFFRWTGDVAVASGYAVGAGTAASAGGSS
jgi:chitin disaccharide deacetylase